MQTLMRLLLPHRLVERQDVRREAVQLTGLVAPADAVETRQPPPSSASPLGRLRGDRQRNNTAITPHLRLDGRPDPLGAATPTSCPIGTTVELRAHDTPIAAPPIFRRTSIDSDSRLARSIWWPLGDRTGG